MKGFDKKVFVLIALAVITRFLPHPPNFTAIGAIALMGGALLPKWWKYAMPLAILLLSDILIQLLYGNGFYPDMLFVYGAFMLTALLGNKWLSNRLNFGRTMSGAVLASLLFFLLTNLGVWATGIHYPMTGSGLIAAYAAALPFYNQDVLGSFAFNTLFSTTLYSGAIYLVYRYALVGKSLSTKTQA